MAKVAQECYDDPDMIKGAPYNASKHQSLNAFAEEFDEIATTWRQFRKKYKA